MRELDEMQEKTLRIITETSIGMFRRFEEEGIDNHNAVTGLTTMAVTLMHIIPTLVEPMPGKFRIEER